MALKILPLRKFSDIPDNTLIGIIILDNREIAKMFEHIGKLLELKGESVFKYRAYYNASRIISDLPFSLESAVKEDSVKNIKGIGDALEKKIKEIFSTGKLDYLENLVNEIPPGIIEMLKIPGLGPKKIFKLSNTLGIKTLDELENACNSNLISVLPGFGEKTQENILKGISLLKIYSGRVLYSDAWIMAENILSYLKNIPQITRASVAGSIRRCMETVKDIDIVLSAKEDLRNDIIEKLALIPEVERVFEKGVTKTSVRFINGIVCNFRIVNESEFIFALHHFTGSAQHNTALRSYAKKHGLKINEYGIFKDDFKIEASSESDFFSILNMSYIPPEIRENTGEIEAAVEKKLPELIKISDLKGIFHVHTNWSDGSETLSSMALAAEDMGYEYIGISDHSQSAGYAGGLTNDRVLHQIEEIDEFNSSHRGIRILKGIESEILHDGSLDYNEEILEKFDFVIASIHSWFNMTENESNKRIEKAMSNPFVTMLGHPTGRLLLTREGYPLNMESLLDLCAEKNIIVELNANPHRLDIDWRHLREAQKRGVKISINPDSHNKETLAHVSYGINIARKGWLTSKDVFNTGSFDEILSFLKRE